MLGSALRNKAGSHSLGLGRDMCPTLSRVTTRR